MSARPDMVLPQDSCDCHFHVFGPADRYPYGETRSYTPADAMLGDYLGMAARLGISRCVIVQPSVYAQDNRLLLDSLAELGDRGRGVVVIDDTVDDDTLESMHRLGVRGARFNLLFAGGVDLTIMDRVAERIKELGWHIQVLMDVRDLPDQLERIESLPVPVVFDHMGHMATRHGIEHPGFQTLLTLLRGRRCWVKLSGPYRISSSTSLFEDVRPFAASLLDAAPDRCVWATDWPHPSPLVAPPPAHELLAMLLDWAEDEKTACQVLHDNPARLYWSSRSAGGTTSSTF